jgi:hypothetical protein
LALQCIFISFTLILFLPAPPRTSEDSDDDETIGAKAAEEMDAHDEEEMNALNNQVNYDPSELMEDSDNEDNDSSNEFRTNGHQSSDEFAPPNIDTDTGTFWL